ncbi:MAG TPA: energy-coupling factor transporter transmembrane protein EcfT [Moorella mulderi]|nr:energy-coupling factor transporter transmembrane protein EcfT [Moorella mulderi]
MWELGQYVPGDSFLHRLDPRTKLVSMLLYGLTLLLAPTWQILFLAGLPLLPLLGAAGLPWGHVWAQLKPLIPFLLVIFLFQAFYTPGEVVAAVGPWAISREGLDYGLLALGRVVFLLLAATLLTAITDTLALGYALEWFFWPAERWGVPAGELALMLTLALRFIPTLMEEGERILRAQIARGAKLRATPLHLLPFLIPLFVSAFRRAETLALAMEARGYRGSRGRTRMREYRFQFLDYLFLLGIWSLTAWILYLRFKGC